MGVAKGRGWMWGSPCRLLIRRKGNVALSNLVNSHVDFRKMPIFHLWPLTTGVLHFKNSKFDQKYG